MEQDRQAVRDGERTTVREVTFPGATGADLAATLELPDGRPLGYAVMAHCFTCTSDAHATTRISRLLAERGYAVLRFDFTGLGDSEGDFAETTFTTNVEDLVTAAAWMGREWGDVGLLVGHSFGGAAVIAAAGQIDTVRAVVTVAAPASTDHVRHLLRGARPSDEGEDRLQVDIGGRPFVIGQSFLDDISEQSQTERLGAMDAALLVLHSPQDRVVGIDQAGKIFAAADHPRSFVSLDGADHLLSDHADAEFAAGIIATWAARYVPEPDAAAADETGAQPRDEAAQAVATAQVTEPVPEAVRVTERSADAGYAHTAEAGRHTWVLDEPTAAGGDNDGPDPYQVMLSALGACTSMTMRMYARRKGWDYGATSVTVQHSRIHAKDCEDCETKEGRLERIDRTITLDPSLSEEQHVALLRIADKCPVHRTLTGTVEIFTEGKVSRD
ncbi:alpha/beta fold hydrolase [uncultured Ornithinimicrobium sp.]|uniref:bifunctional alpha/beta hydrolase/OsmC family protein n=1 Tax=uncultured Ornithinimicrobium sp. TaxID=259307 RepID=UPI002596DBFD|nr:alpha/beta fold hydrolase [uncultured Ornithinimicrobium sp.]